MATTFARPDQVATTRLEAPESSWRLVAIISALAFTAFILIQILLAERVATRMIHDFLVTLHKFGQKAYQYDSTGAQLLRPGWVPLWLRGPVLPMTLWAMAEYVAVAVSALAVARGKDWRRWLFVVPALAWTALPAIFLNADVAVPGASSGGFEARQLLNVGMTWQWWSPRGNGFLVNLGIAVCLMLALIPAAAIAATSRRGSRSGTKSIGHALPARGYQVAALVVVVFSFGLWVDARAFVAYPQYPWTAALPVFVPLLLVGLLTDVRRPWLAGATLLVSVLIGLDWLGRLEVGLQGWPSYGVAPGTFVLFAVPLAVGLAWQPLARGIGWLAERPLVNLVVLNVLNVADAMLTSFALHSEQAAEANPVIRAVGVPVKILAVAVLGWLLYRAKPRAVVWPVVAFVGVLGWHIAGYVMSSQLL